MPKKNQNPYDDDEFDQDELDGMHIEDIDNYIDDEYDGNLSDDEFEKYVEENMKNLSELDEGIYDDPSSIVNYDGDKRKYNNEDDLYDYDDNNINDIDDNLYYDDEDDGTGNYR